MVAIVLSLALALLPHSGSHASGRFPTRGIITPGTNFAGIKIGDTQARVKTVWGGNYTTCTYCDDVTWLYEYPFGEPLGAAVRYKKGKVVAIFNLGSPAGWRTTQGLVMGDPISNIYSIVPSTSTVRCIGFDAIVTKTGKTVTAYYSAAGVIYGFAIIVPGLTVCQ